MYFDKLPIIYYNFPVAGEERVFLIKDVSINVRFIKETLENITLYDEYDIIDGDTPEVIAHRVYGSTQYHWALMLANLRFDYVNDWPLQYDRLQEYVKSKYGVDNMYTTRHYENADGFVVNSDAESAYPVSNMDYEERINESKRRIKLVSKHMIDQITVEFGKLLND